MKKTISLLLSAIMLLTVLMANTTAYAEYDNMKNAREMEFSVDYSGYLKYDDLNDYYRFSVPISSIATLHFYGDTYNGVTDTPGKIRIYVYESDGTERGYADLTGTKEMGYIESSVEEYFNPGIYYWRIEGARQGTSFDSSMYTQGAYTVRCELNPQIAKPSSLKVSSRKTTSLGLSWSKVGDIDGYQLQRNTSNGWKQVANTISNSYTVKGLKAGVKYDFRVRSYVEADGKKYYSGWKTLATPTKPATVSIKTPSTNKKHQIIAKWKKVSKGTGYQVQYSKKKNFSFVIATKTVSGISKTSYTGKNFTKGKKYYVRVRAYKTVDGTKYYGSWSKAKSIKCK